MLQYADVFFKSSEDCSSLIGSKPGFCDSRFGSCIWAGTKCCAFLVLSVECDFEVESSETHLKMSSRLQSEPLC